MSRSAIAARTAAASVHGCSLPLATGTPACCASRRAASLSPSSSIVPGVGPTKRSPASSHERARWALSDRNP